MIGMRIDAEIGMSAQHNAYPMETGDSTASALNSRSFRAI